VKQKLRRNKMGTNYYVRFNHCKQCNRYEEVHIGKSSYGWTFSFHATEECKSYKDWLKFLSKEGVDIFDEYDRKVSLDDFKKLVGSKKDSEHNHTKEYPEGSYLDDEGNSMTTCEFS
jgi:hypothetical protein